MELKKCQLLALLMCQKKSLFSSLASSVVVSQSSSGDTDLVPQFVTVTFFGPGIVLRPTSSDKKKRRGKNTVFVSCKLLLTKLESYLKLLMEFFLNFHL